MPIVTVPIVNMTATEVEDRQLIERVQQGEREAFTEIVQRHQGAVFGYLRARLIDGADAEDLTQEVFLRCYCARARFDSSQQIRPWLLGIARNLLREHLRSSKRRKETGWTNLCLEIEDPVEPEGQYEEVIGFLPKCLDALGRSAREAIHLRYKARMRMAQIGEKLHRSEGAVKLLMFRARQTLRTCLSHKCREQADVD